jgi:hypothetical protein
MEFFLLKEKSQTIRIESYVNIIRAVIAIRNKQQLQTQRRNVN